MKIPFQKNKPDSIISEYLPMMLIAALLILQIFVSYYIAYKQEIETHVLHTQQILHRQITEDEARSSTLATLAATVATDSDVIRILANKPDSFLDLSTTCKRIRKYASIATPIKNVYFYSRAHGVVYDSFAGVHSINSNSIASITAAIEQYDTTGISYYMEVLTNTNQSAENNSSFINIYRADNKLGDLILICREVRDGIKNYSDLQYDLKSNLIVCTDNGHILYGMNEYVTGDFFPPDNDIFSSRNTDSLYTMSYINSQGYVTSYSHSDSLGRWYIQLTPKSAIMKNGFFSENYIYTYICILLALVTLLRVFSLWKRLRIIILNTKLNNVLSKNDDEDSTFELHLNLITDTPASRQQLYDYITQKANGMSGCAVMLAKIDNIKELDSSYSSTDIELIKYGMDNICTEIFANHGFYAIRSNETDDMLEYIILFEGKDNFDANFAKAAEELIVSLRKYIHMETSYFAGCPTDFGNVQESYSIAHKLLEYSFSHGMNAILTESDACRATQEELDGAKSLCDTIKQNIQNADDDYHTNIQTLRLLLKQMDPSQTNEILYYLLINLYSATEQLEKQHKIVLIFDVSSCFVFLESAKFCDEIIDIANTLFCDTKNLLSDKLKPHSSQLVSECMKIIEESYSDENLCVEEVAKRMNFSANYLGRKFKQLTGTSISTKITEIRLDAAANEIVKTNDKIQDIIKRVGFINNSHFTALFRKRFGESPVNYRHSHKQ